MFSFYWATLRMAQVDKTICCIHVMNIARFQFHYSKMYQH